MYRVLIIFSFLLFVLSGCGSEGSQSPGDTAPSTNQKPDMTIPAYIHGQIGLGVGEGAVINLRSLLGPEEERAKVLASARSDAHGMFTLEVKRQFLHQPVLVEVDFTQADQNCIAVQGCGESIDFGSVVDQPEAILLQTAIASLSADMNYSVGIQSTFAAQAALAELSGLNLDQDNGVADITTKFIVSKANSQVASRLGAIGDLPTATILPITDILVVASSQPAELFSTFLESALVSSCAELTHNDAYWLNACADQYVNMGVPGRSAYGDQEISMLQILDNLLKVYQ